MKKAILKLEVRDDKEKKKVMKTVSGLSGVDSISMEMKDKKLTVIGDIDPVKIASKLRKLCHTEIVSVGPAKEPEKKKDDGNKKKDEPKKDDVAELLKADKAYNPHMTTYHHFKSASVEEDPNACVIC